MTPRKRAGLWALAAVALVGLVYWAVAWQRARNLQPAALLGRVPHRDSVVVYLDFAALRGAGLLRMLAGANVAEEPEYRTFVQRTRFDYQRDLDSALVAFAPRARYFLLRGRFDWAALRSYVAAEGGSCAGDFCRLTGTTPERRISFFPLQTGLMAMAVSTDDAAALTLRSEGAPAAIDVPMAPAWMSIPQTVLRSGNGLPAGTRMFARGMENASGVILSLGAEKDRFAARLDVRCRNAEDATALAGQLNRTTRLLLDLIQREHKQPNPADLSGVLTSGAFRSEGVRVAGYWPIQRAFVEGLLAGGTP